MQVSGLDSEGDWRLGRGFASYKHDSDAIAQSVVCRIKEFLNDWFLDIERGIDWIALLGTPGTEAAIDQALRRTILETDGIVALTKFDLVVDRNARTVAVTAIYNDLWTENVGLSTIVGGV